MNGGLGTSGYYRGKMIWNPYFTLFLKIILNWSVVLNEKTKQKQKQNRDFRKLEIIFLTMSKGKIFKIRKKKIDKLYMNNCG